MAGEFPTPQYGGPQYLLYIKHAKDYEEITVFSRYEDGGVDTNEHATDAPQRWTLSYNGLTEAQAKVLDDHYNSHRLSQKFTFTEPRADVWSGVQGHYGTTYSNAVQYESYERPDHEKYKIQARIVHLVKYPS